MVVNKELNTFSRKLNSFNALRLVLALIVLIGHSGLISGNHFPFTVGKIQLTSLAVYCFFIISGYLITPGLQQGGVRNYMIRRCIRIYPAYVGVITAVGFGFSILWEYLSSDNSISIFHSVRYFFLNIIPPPGLFNQQSRNVNFFGGQPIAVPVNGISNGSLWSLTFEFIAYLSLVVIFSFSKKVRKPFKIFLLLTVTINFIWAIITSIFLDTYSLKSPSEFQAVLLKWPYLLCFFLGALLSLTSYSKKVYKGKFALPLILFLLSSTKPLYFAIFGAICLTFFTVNLGESKIFSKISPRVDISYGIYLYHFPVEQTLAHFKYMREHLFLFILISVFLTSTFALFSAKYIEAPCQRKAKAWILNHQ